MANVPNFLYYALADSKNESSDFTRKGSVFYEEHVGPRADEVARRVEFIAIGTDGLRIRGRP